LALWADRDLLFQVAANLVDNALKYGKTDGNINVCAKHYEQYVEVSVSDDGPGFPVQEMDKAFRRFYRVEASRGTLPGNGLGLSMVEAVIKLHKGSVVLGDNNPGLKVVITLPKVSSE
jgi:signal transduction histidine kinase